jgi:hypothetical protein
MATGSVFSGGGSGHVVYFEDAHGGFIAKLKRPRSTDTYFFVSSS